VNDRNKKQNVSPERIFHLSVLHSFCQRCASFQYLLLYHSVDIDSDRTVCTRNDITENARIAQDFKASLPIRP